MKLFKSENEIRDASLLFLLIIVGSVLLIQIQAILHEIGHLLISLILGLRIVEFRIGFWNGMVVVDNLQYSLLNPLQLFILFIAGYLFVQIIAFSLYWVKKIRFISVFLLIFNNLFTLFAFAIPEADFYVCYAIYPTLTLIIYILSFILSLFLITKYFREVKL